MSMTSAAQRVLKVLQESGPRHLTVVEGLTKGGRRELERVVGELFIFGVVKWVGKKRGRRLSAARRKA